VDTPSGTEVDHAVGSSAVDLVVTVGRLEFPPLGWVGVVS